MDRAVTPPFAAAAARRLQRQRWAARGGAALVLGLSLAYASLPLWLPTDRVRRSLESQLSDDLGTPVQIAGLRVGWLQGVVLEGLTVADAQAGQKLARVGEIRCDLSPFSLALGDTVRVLEIVKPEVWLNIDENGQLRLPRFNQKRGARLPSLSYAVRGLTCNVITPNVSQRFRIDRIDLQLDPLSGLLHLASATRVQRPAPDADEPKTGLLDFNANIRIPRLKKSEALNGSIEAEWSDLALNDLPVPLISHVPVEQVDGTTSGQLTIRTHPDLGIDYTVAIVFDGVRIMRPDLNRPAQVPDAELACSGHWDPTGGLLTVQNALYESPALRIESAGGGVPLLRMEENGDVPLAVRLKGRIKDWRELRAELPEFDEVARTAGAHFSGQATFTAEVERNRREDRASLQLEGQQSRWVIRRGNANYLHAEAGVPKEIRLESIRERTGGRVRQPVFALRIGDAQLDASGEIVPPAPAEADPPPLLDQMAAAFSSLRARAHLRCADAANLVRTVPWLAARPEIDALSGPLDLDFTVDPQEQWTRIGCSAALPEESVFRAGEAIRKHAGRSLRIAAEVRVPYASAGRVDLLNLDLRHGAGRLELTSRNGCLIYDTKYREMPSGPVLVKADGSWKTDLVVESVEDLVELSPLLSRRLQAAGITFLSGGLEANGLAEFSYRPGDTLFRNRMHVIADDLALRVRDGLAKKAGEPLSLELTHHWRSEYDTAENYWAAALTGPAGKVSGSLLRGVDSQTPAERFEFVTARAEINDISDLRAAAPGLADRIGLTVSGGLSAHLQRIRTGNWQAGTASLDCTPASFLFQPLNPAQLPLLSGLRKSAGIPMTASASWEARPTTDGTGETLEIHDAQVQLAHAAIDHLKGRLVVPFPRDERAPDLAGLSGGSIEADGSILFDEHLESVHPALREQCRRASTQGTLGWRIAAEIQPEAIAIQGQLDGTSASFSTALNDTPFSLIRKPAGEPFVATLDISCPRRDSATAGQIAVRHAALRMSDNSIIARGVVTQHSMVNDRPLNSLSLDVSADLPHLERLLCWVPNAPLESLKGGLLAEASLLAENGAVTVTSGRVQLNEVELGPAARPLRVDGSATFAEDAVNLEQLDFGWGRSSGTLSGTLTSADDRCDARLGFNGREINVEDLLACLAQMRAGLPNKTSNATTAPTSRRANGAAQVIDLLRRTRATIDAQADTVSTPLPLGIKATFDAGWQRLDLQNSTASMEFGCLVDGGRVSGQVTADLNAADPKYRLTYTADRIQPGAVVDAYLRRTFPGMVATGPLTLIDETVQRLTPAPGEPNPEIGEGELIIDGGTISGRAAPMWMARIFPGLNIASFQFTRMHSWFEKDATPRVHHQMIYQGDYYNVYMIGWSNPQGYFQYEVGIDFLAGLESEYWANSGQGRVPLFTKSGQVRPDGSLADETVNFVSLSRVLETLFVRNNPVITAYHAVRKRVLGKK